MSDMESMSKMILAMMQVVRKQESIENQQKEQKASATKCLQAILTKQGQFDGQNVTKYLKGYFPETMIYKINREMAVREFPTLVEPDLKSLVEALATTATGSEAWLIFEQRMKEEFQLEDAARPTWVDSERSWAQVEKAVMKVSHRHRRRELDQEAITRRPDATSSNNASEAKEVKNGIPDDMAELIRTFLMLAT
ncbi:unnamed protein product [Calypogeia fissa]